MRFLINRWRQIGTRLYLALVFAVILTLLSSAVGIYYFERSGDLSYRIRSESAPAVDAAWAAAVSAEKLRSHGREVIAGLGSDSAVVGQADVGEILNELEESLNQVIALQDLEPLALAVQDSAYDMAAVIDRLVADLEPSGRPALVAEFENSSDALDQSVGLLVDSAGQYADVNLTATVGSFDQGRVLLATICLISVVAATLTAWIWVGNGVLRRLSRVSDRMRSMAQGDLETPVPEVSRDEIGQLAGALEVFRQHALEVQRLNLVEQLYQELRVANDELQTMQARLVAQEKLAALGELVSGVAHEISNPLNFVKNFSQGATELHSELTEMLDTYRDGMKSEDVALLDDITNEMSDSLGRVITNGGRALAIVERMQGLSVDTRPPQMVDLNTELQDAAVSAGAGYDCTPEFAMDDSIGSMPIVVEEFKEAVGNLVANACYAMSLKKAELGEEYEPALSVSSRLVDGVVEVRVRDNGPGIADDVRDRVFNPFFTTQEGVMGAGLGLTIAADVARRAGGDLLLDTVYGDYAEFLMTMPVPETAAVGMAVLGDVDEVSC